jgi:hypothetical protein
MPSFKDNLKGIPTADQEALQAPSVDPINTIGMAAGFGPMMASKLLFQQLIANAILPQLGRMNAFPLPTRTSQLERTGSNLGSAHLQDISDYLAHQNKETPFGVSYQSLDDFNRWIASKWLNTKANSIGDKVFSTIIRRSPYVNDYMKKYGDTVEQGLEGLE